ncbi:tetratricopeptide (TPR) repeat protein [Spirosoma lacussanchae]|uniref:tetratricopeptide repeat protein n=1 Tax=Spirosoma lacussanchae TaxID=1884249 RepID=UPI00110823E4|nr:tetratricopeptide repeat protein [Spirosoma lacussanchae]
MTQLRLLLLLLPALVRAQTGEQALKSCASMLALNRTVPALHFFAHKREQTRQDSLQANGLASRFRGLWYIRQQDYEQAADWFEKTAARFPKEQGAIGEFYLSMLADPVRALHHLNAFDALTPTFDDHINHNPVSYLRGLAYRHLSDHDRALEQFSKAIDALEQKHGAEWVNYRQYVSRAVSYLATNRADKALADLDKANKNFGRSALVNYHRGRALQQLGRLTEARTAFQDALFFYRALRVERSHPLEDDFNPLYESDIDAALAALKPKP